MPFVKGKSGNPNGRPKLERHKPIEDWAKLAFDEVGRDKLMEIARSSDYKSSIKAIGIILERAYGKAPQSIDVSMDVNFSSIVGEMVRELDIEINK